VFAKGGAWTGAKQDNSIDRLTFLNVAHTIAHPLASQNYIPSKDAKITRLLIMVYWGTTRAPEHATESYGYEYLGDANGALSAAKMDGAAHAIPYEEDEVTTAVSAVSSENRKREMDDLSNLKLLGYDSWWEQTQGDHRGTALEQSRQDMYDEIEQDRYFVVLMAYDFQMLWKEKKHKLLWETRFSIRQMHHQFDKDLLAMAQFASQYFGQDSNGLVHKVIPLGRVDIGEMKSLGDVPEK
jgi:hypothetical protein